MDKLKQMADDALVTLYLEGNSSAFDVLLNRHKDRLFNYIFFIVRSKEVAEDIFQETFVKAIVTDNKSYIKVAVDGGYIHLDEVQLAGKKRMPVADLLRGFSIEGMTLVK